jgi:hypothetical protein
MKEKISQLHKHPKTPAILTALMFGGVSFAAVHNIPNPPIFPNTDNFVIFAEQSLSFEESATVSSGDVGTNGTLDIGKDATINGNLFADKITIAKNTTINGNAAYNKISNKGEILGTKTAPTSLPIANQPDVQPFIIGTQDKTFSGNANTLPAGNYKNITIQKDSILILSGGTYNLNILDLKDRSTIIFNAETTLNIQFKLRGRDTVSILNGQNAKPQDLHINYVGTQAKQFKNDRREDDEDEIQSTLDKQERDDCKNQKIGRPIVFGKNSFLNFALIAPKANVIIGKDGTLRGQILARKVKIGKNFIATKNETFEKESDPTKIVTDVDGTKFFVNEVIVLFADEATNADMETIATLIGGKISGIVTVPKIAKIEIPTATIQELRNKIQKIKNMNNPLVIDAGENVIFEQQ